VQKNKRPWPVVKLIRENYQEVFLSTNKKRRNFVIFFKNMKTGENTLNEPSSG
jgi:hypothetical protein